MQLETVIPWIYTTAVLVGGGWLFWKSKAKIDKLLPERAIDPNAPIRMKFWSAYQNEILALGLVMIIVFSVRVAGLIAYSMFGKTTLATASEGTILGIEQVGNFFTWAADGIAGVDLEPPTPEEARDLMKEKSLFSIDTSETSDDQSYSIPSSEIMASANYGVPNANTNYAAPAAQSQPVAVPTQSVNVPVATPETSSVVLNPGDTLAKLAQAKYGDASMWRYICAVNQLADCNNVRSGTTLIIPTDTSLAVVDATIKNFVGTAVNPNPQQAIAAAAHAPNAQPAAVQMAAPVSNNVSAVTVNGSVVGYAAPASMSGADMLKEIQGQQAVPGGGMDYINKFLAEQKAYADQVANGTK